MVIIIWLSFIQHLTLCQSVCWVIYIHCLNGSPLTNQQDLWSLSPSFSPQRDWGLEMAELGFRPWQMNSVSLGPWAILMAFCQQAWVFHLGGPQPKLVYTYPFLSSTPSCLCYFLKRFSDALPGYLYPLPWWTLNARATLVLFGCCTSFPEDMLFSLGLKWPSAINIKNLPSEKSSFLRSLWGLEFLSRPCYIGSPLSFTSPLCAPARVCFQHQSDVVFCSNLFILIVCPYCCVLRIEWSGENRTSPLLPPLGGFRFHVLDLCWWRDENACHT